MLDDERLCASVLPATDLHGGADEAWRSAEVMRFMGWLRRELQALGERLVLDADPRDPRPGLLLRRFLNGLYQAGALRGKRPEDAYRLTQGQDGEATLIFEIEIAPAFALDRIRLTFLHDRHSGAVEISGG